MASDRMIDAEQDAGRQVAEPELLGDEIARGRAEREGEEDREPVEGLAPAS